MMMTNCARCMLLPPKSIRSIHLDLGVDGHGAAKPLEATKPSISHMGPVDTNCLIDTHMLAGRPLSPNAEPRPLT